MEERTFGSGRGPVLVVADHESGLERALAEAQRRSNHITVAFVAPRWSWTCAFAGINTTQELARDIAWAERVVGAGVRRLPNSVSASYSVVLDEARLLALAGSKAADVALVSLGDRRRRRRWLSEWEAARHPVTRAGSPATWRALEPAHQRIQSMARGGRVKATP
jgi:hypothetical protein